MVSNTDRVPWLMKKANRVVRPGVIVREDQVEQITAVVSEIQLLHP